MEGIRGGSSLELSRAYASRNRRAVVVAYDVINTRSSQRSLVGCTPT